MKKIIPIAFVLILLMINCSRRIPGDWDCYEEMNTDMLIKDSLGCAIGMDLSNNPDTLIDSIGINVVLNHDNPSDLFIWLTHGTDTVLLWDNDFIGETQTISVDGLVGKKANMDWMVYVIDEIENGKEGRLKQVTLMIRYR